ncbi:LysR family transcriptional regulator [uncultured Thalassolituus sp.]|uniref:LysR family transcriptional regulator n=1 Tax=uncultured Thalassolituus sp. TaxID=285273 RepID=UPI00262DC92B|nr:LysR family transcriptional regulator [uncultured Thalassolituus sp.]
MDRIEAMRALVTVVAEGSFTAAASRLEMSPQLVSKYVGQLETHLGVRLLNRTTRQVHLTEVGTRYVQQARQILTDIEDMENQAGDDQSRARGLLRIAAPVSFASLHLAAPLVAFQQAHPEVGIDLQLNDRKVDIVNEGFDVALRIGHLKDSSLVAKRLATIRLAYCASPEYLRLFGTPESETALADHRFLQYSYTEDDRHRALAAGFTCNNGEVLNNAAIAGAGIVLQPTFISGAALADGRLVEILQKEVPEPIALYAVYAHRTLVSSKIRLFIDFMGDYFGERPYWDR